MRISFIKLFFSLFNYCFLHLGTVGAVVGIASGVNSLMSDGGSSSGAASTASGLADPAQAYRSGWAGQFNKLLTAGPGGLADNAMFKSWSDASTQQLQRQMAAKGQTQSGQEQIALKNLDQSNMYNYWTSMLNPYMNLIGTPAGGATGYLQGLSTGGGLESGAWKSISQGLGGLSNIYGGSSGQDPSWYSSPSGYQSYSDGYYPSGGSNIDVGYRGE